MFIGYDAAEPEAVRVAAKSLNEVTNGELEAEFLDSEKLVSQGLLYRPLDHRGQAYDIISGSPVSTDFANSRFLTPILCQEGFALFTDCDVVFQEDPRNMLDDTGAQEHAVYVVKHRHKPVENRKMGGQIQTTYYRKNWSSVMLFDCDMLANHRLSLRDVNERPGRDLHRFYWLNDAEIGELHPRWNWLVNVQPPSVEHSGRGIAHFTLGGPFIAGWKGAPHDDLWWRAAG